VVKRKSFVMRLAIIDLGTNTFNILIGEFVNQQLNFLFSTKEPVKLGLNGFTNELPDDAIQRAINTIGRFNDYMNTYEVKQVRCFATSAFRTAANGAEVMQLIKNTISVPSSIALITGDEEAEFIYYGVRQAINFNEKYLILDIGGGSNEYIIADGQKIYWKQSFPLGVARLAEKFKYNEPISEKTSAEIVDYLVKELEPLAEALKKFPVHVLVGASGAFDSYVDLIYPETRVDRHPYKKTFQEIDLIAFNNLHQHLLLSTKEERLQLKHLLKERADSIVLALLITHTTITMSSIKKLFQVEYSLKEGAMISLC
jgi:exopolyphosphatase / guanosine-5'-triphosphate,3'-diphosphate pyrophosphatase